MAIVIVFIAVIGLVAFVSLKHQSNVVTTQDVGLDLTTVNVGEARNSLEGNMDKETLVSNLLLKIADAHKDHNHETLVSYVFLDGNGNVTNDDDNIKSVQFEVKLLNKKGKCNPYQEKELRLIL